MPPAEPVGALRRWVKAFSRVAKRRAAEAARAFRGLPPLLPALSAQTLDEDDADIARRWLADRTRWKDASVTEEYERDFASRLGFRRACAFDGGRAALSACLRALDLKPGDEVIVPGYTCVVVFNAFLFAGVRAVHADIELETFGLDASGLDAKLTPRTRAVLLHHLFGLICRDYEKTLAWARSRGLKVIEDCAHSAGAEYQGLKAGKRGDLAFFSSERSKVYNTFMGGVAATDDERLARELEAHRDAALLPEAGETRRRLHTLLLDFLELKGGERWRRDLADLLHGHERAGTITPEELRGLAPPGYGGRMPPPLAAIGLNQLRKMDAYNALRRTNALRWDRYCLSNGYRKPLVLPGSIPVFLSYPVMVEPQKRADASWASAVLGVEPGTWFTNDFRPSAWRAAQDCPNAVEAHSRCVFFPTL
ncbi:MAG: DegT/DnrJ/EryC1/StrS family aminotransferase [Elusimicrobiota bacterium]